MKKGICLLLAALLALGCFGLSGCSGEDTVTITVYNWGQYMARGEDGCIDVIALFEEAYPGIKVNYVTVEDNETLYTKLKNGGISVDVIIPSDYMIARLISEDMLLPLNYDNIPNYSYINDDLKGMYYDPDELYSVPYTWGTVGIIYNTKYVSTEEVEEKGWGILWEESYSDKILMFSNSRDAFGIACYLLGYDVNTTDTDELNACAALLAEQKSLVQQYVMDQVFSLMEGEEAWIAPYYAGDYLTMAESNEDLAFYRPTEQGFNRFVDAMCIPSCAEHQEEAELFINFVTDPEIMAGNMEYVYYSAPADAAKAYMDEDMASDPVSYPSEEDLASATFFALLPDETTRYVEDLFIQIRAGSYTG
ncbi:MAG: spermidine/putrescine ABC transporter substrate-binding protein [Firmicutes bacterium]|nr:spermidine/putrescine ABC transporter substrate-binding protein [Bacillota bacterium]